jgi:putative colanic acid biosynthesis acetyltransferase WcaF
VLAAGSMASKDLEPYTIYQGNPAQPVRERIIDPA